MGLIKRIITRVFEQRKLEKEFADENLMSYSFIDYQRAKVNYLNWINGKKFKTVRDHKRREYGRK